MTIWQKISDAATKTVSFDALRAGVRNVADQLGLTSDKDVPADGSLAFTMALIALSAKMAKADGVVMPVEVVAFNRVMKVPESEIRNVERLFNLAKADVAGYEAYAGQVGRLLAGDRPKRQMVIEALFHIGTADRALHPKEDEYLAVVSTHLGFTASEYQYFRGRFVHSVDQSPYDILGVSPTISNAELKARYRFLAHKNHPDTLIANGVPAEMISIGTRKMQAITEAYKNISRERSL